MKKFKVCKDFEYLDGHLRYGHAEVSVEAETEEEALEKAKESFKKHDYEIVVDDFEIDDHGDFEGDAYIAEE